MEVHIDRSLNALPTEIKNQPANQRNYPLNRTNIFNKKKKQIPSAYLLYRQSTKEFHCYLLSLGAMINHFGLDSAFLMLHNLVPACQQTSINFTIQKVVDKTEGEQAYLLLWTLVKVLRRSTPANSDLSRDSPPHHPPKSAHPRHHSNIYTTTLKQKDHTHTLSACHTNHRDRISMPIQHIVKIMSENDKIESHISKRFQIAKKIGSGAYGIVWKVMDRRTREFFALKKNFDAFQNSTDAQRTYRQIMYLKKFKHPNIIQPREVIRSLNEKDIYILFEYMDIDLYTLIRENMLGEQHKRYIMYQVAKSIHYLHSAELIHRDIKPSNVLVNEDCHAKICDFGLVRSLFHQKDELPPVLTQYIATRWYRAPQILLGSKKYSKPADVWSFGCMLGELIIGKPMFPGNSTLNQIERVITWTGPPTIQDLKSLKTDFGKEMLDILTKIKPKNHKEWFINIAPDALDLITKILNFNPQKRPTMLQVLKHPFMRQFYVKSEITEAKQAIIIEVDDNSKLTLKEYRELIYQLVEEYETKLQNKSGMSQSFVEKPQIFNIAAHQNQNKTVYKNRLGSKGLARSASKNKEDSLPKSSQKESNTMSIKKKYESLLCKGKQQMVRTKYVKTQEIDEKDKLFPKRKKSDNIVKYYTSDKKKKSVSLYEAKRDSEVLAKYMYEHRKI